jgi:hypothetical protein
MAWHSDLYRLPAGGGLGWRENVRGIALTLEALRAVDRYGAVHTDEQYQGFRAIDAAPPTKFGSADEAMRWLHGRTGHAWNTAKDAYRAAAREMHPDVGGDPTEWARLDEARQLMEREGIL